MRIGSSVPVISAIIFAHIVLILLGCQRRAPPWILQEMIIEQGPVEKGYVTEAVSTRPSENLAHLRCLTQAKVRLQNVIRGKIEEDFRNFYDYPKNIEPHREKVKLFREMMKEISFEMIQRLSDRIENEGIYIDRENSLLFCRLSLRFDESFYNVLKEVGMEIVKSNYYRPIYDEQVPIKLGKHIDDKMRTLRSTR